MQKIIGINYAKLGKMHYCTFGNANYKIGDTVVVDVSGSLMVAQVATEVKEVEGKAIVDSLYRIVRMANPSDIKTWKELQVKAKNALKTIGQKVRSLALDMKIVGATYTLEGNKIVIDFTAEERVDFRELLKDLAAALKVKIELKQIGQRDEVKIKGGLGPCGEICCCSRFLNDFEHVSVKMAKNQGLSLSPTKISGLCGRLMCCLAYENPTYDEILKRMPKVGSNVKTPTGSGTVVYNDILRELVSVRENKEDEMSNIKVHPLSDIVIMPNSEYKKERFNGLQNKSK